MGCKLMDKEKKVRIVKGKCLADALVWLGFKYEKDENDNYIFERDWIFDVAWKDLHALRSDCRDRIKRK